MRLTVYLGSKCNLNCAYCHREADAVEPAVSEEFLDRLSRADDLMIKFMGGEPTLYMDTIKRFIDKLPNARFALSTNGVLLDKYIDYFREHKVFLCISYDGVDDLRGFDPFTKLINYPWLHVSCTVYHGNTDLKKIYDNFAKKEDIVGRSLSFYPHIMHVTNEVNDKYKLTFDDMDSLIYQTKAIMEEFYQHYIMTGSVLKKYFGLYSHLCKALNANYELGETHCVNKSVAKVDVTGQAYSCQYIRDEAIRDWRDISVKAKCKNCSVYDMCGGACIKSKEHDVECYYYKKLYTWFREWYCKRTELKQIRLPKPYFVSTDSVDNVYLLRAKFNQDIKNYVLELADGKAVVTFNGITKSITLDKIPKGDSAVVLRSKKTGVVKVIYGYKKYLEQYDMTPSEYSTCFSEPLVLQISVLTNGLFVKCFAGEKFSVKRNGVDVDYKEVEFTHIHDIDRRHSFSVFPCECDVENGVITTVWRVMISADYNNELYVNYNGIAKRVREGLVKIEQQYVKGAKFYWGNKGTKYKGRVFSLEEV